MTRKGQDLMQLLPFWRYAVVAGMLFSLESPLSADILLSLLPADGNVSGPPGFLVGWGYSLNNTDPSNWLMSTNLNSDSFSNGTPTSLFDFPILAPGGSVTESFDSVNSIGLFELQWDPSAPVGFINSGNFVLSGQWWDGDPSSGGNFIADAPYISLPYSATVAGSVNSPEPSSFLLLAIGIAAMLGCRKVRTVRFARLAVGSRSK